MRLVLVLGRRLVVWPRGLTVLRRPRRHRVRGVVAAVRTAISRARRLGARAVAGRRRRHSPAAAAGNRPCAAAAGLPLLQGVAAGGSQAGPHQTADQGAGPGILVADGGAGEGPEATTHELHRYPRKGWRRSP